MAALFAMFELQSHLIFPTHAVPAAGPLPSGAEAITLRTGRHQLSGVHIAPPGRIPSDRRMLILGFAGNAWNSQDAAEYLHQLYPEAHVIAFHYRGYAPSSGSPSAEALLEDAPLIYDFAVERVQPGKTIAVGLSIGSGIAAQLSAKRPLDGVVLVTPFDSLKAVAQSLYPWLPIGPFFQHEIDAATALEGSTVPVALVAAERDVLIPPERTAALRKRVGNLVFDRTISRAGHNDLYSRSDFHAAMRDALKAVSG